MGLKKLPAPSLPIGALGEGVSSVCRLGFPIVRWSQSEKGSALLPCRPFGAHKKTGVQAGSGEAELLTVQPVPCLPRRVPATDPRPPARGQSHKPRPVSLLLEAIAVVGSASSR